MNFLKIKKMINALLSFIARKWNEAAAMDQRRNKLLAEAYHRNWHCIRGYY